MPVIKVHEDILLKEIEISDAADIFHTIDSQRDYLGKWLPFVPFTRQVSDTEAFINSSNNLPDEKKELTFVIRYKGNFAGIIGFKGTDRVNRKTEIGYWLSETFQKKGIVTESVKSLVNFAFGESALNRVQIKCAIGNIASKNIPKKLNFEFEGIERDGELLSDGKFTDIEVYSILNRNWNF